MHTTLTKPDIRGFENRVMILFYRDLQRRTITEREETNPIDELKVSRVANDWAEYEKGITQTQSITSLPNTTLTDTLKESCALLFTEEILNFCSKHDIYHECCKYHSLFVERFNYIQKIDVLISEDPEIPDYQKICFVLTIADSIKNVLGHEDDFRNRLDNEIDVEKRQFFAYSYNLI